MVTSTEDIYLYCFIPNPLIWDVKLNWSYMHSMVQKFIDFRKDLFQRVGIAEKTTISFYTMYERTDTMEKLPDKRDWREGIILPGLNKDGWPLFGNSKFG